MTAQEYLTQNLAGFENDIFAKDKFKQLIIENEINLFIETGTYLGSTTKLLSQWCENIITIEVNKNHFNKAKDALKDVSNIEMILGSSEEVLGNVLSGTNIKDKKIGIFLDAHWMAYNPLIDELNVIAKNNIKPVFIAIHDFKVEGHPELGFDSYGGQDYNWDWIKESVVLIYGEDGFKVEYNSEATGAKRGIVYLYPKNWHDNIADSKNILL